MRTVQLHSVHTLLAIIAMLVRIACMRERERGNCYPHQARKAYLGSAMRDR